MKYILLLSVVIAAAQALSEERIHPRLKSIAIESNNHPEEIEPDYWRKKAQSTLADKIKNQNALNTKKAKNVIIFLGDGMSLHTVASTRAFMKDISYEMAMDKFPHSGLAKNYCVDYAVPDSACTVTAFLSGVKSNAGTLGVEANVQRGNCFQALNESTHVKNIASWAQDAGKATGVVTTTRITHASPAGLYATSASRDWENNELVKKDNCDPELNRDIAYQLINGKVGKKLNVIMGGGRAEFRNTTVRDEEGRAGWRTDGRDLIQEWIGGKKAEGVKASYAWSRTGLNTVDLTNTDYLLGLFSTDHCPYNGDRERKNLLRADPSLSEMTESAIHMLKKEKNGFFLFVEGGRIDHAHHAGMARKALEETKEFDNAIRKAHEMTSDEDTLIVVTSDHSHTMTINGYAIRDSDILGLNVERIGDDGLPFTILSYANGPGFSNTYDPNKGRRDLRDDTFHPEYVYSSTVPLDAETHGGGDVAVYASGPQSYLFSAVYEQNAIALLMAKVAEIGPYTKTK